MKLTRILTMAVAAAALSVFAIPADAQIAGAHGGGNGGGTAAAIGTAAGNWHGGGTGMVETGTGAIG